MIKAILLFGTMAALVEAQGSPGVGFVPFDPSQAGHINPIINPPSVPATFPTKVFNPITDY